MGPLIHDLRTIFLDVVLTFVAIFIVFGIGGWLADKVFWARHRRERFYTSPKTSGAVTRLK